MHQPFVIPSPTSPGNNWAFNFSVFQSNSERPPPREQIYGTKNPCQKSLHSGPVFVSWKYRLSVEKINLYLFHSKRSGFLDATKFKGEVSLTV